MFLTVLGLGYRWVVAPICFLFDSEPIHDLVVRVGYVLGRIPGVARCIRACIHVEDPILETTVAGIRFENPIGLAAGFDHEGRLVRFVSALGFGFETMGTVTNLPYAGNAYPRLKRLVRSRSLLVNKGFKSSGMVAVLRRLVGAHFDVPIGISIGRTNTLSHKTEADAIADILSALERVRASGIPFSYIELNISCPNLLNDISFYLPGSLRMLLQAVFDTGIRTPIFIKMPIVLSNEATRALVDVAREFPVAALVVGNLQHRRDDPAFDAVEIAAHAEHKGNWSGMPCQARSDEVIQLISRHTAGAIPIIGCGGIFSGEDAYRKIRCGASLVQLATGLVFEGPQLPAQLCASLSDLLRRDGYTSIEQAVGTRVER